MMIPFKKAAAPYKGKDGWVVPIETNPVSVTVKGQTTQISVIPLNAKQIDSILSPGQHKAPSVRECYVLSDARQSLLTLKK